MAMTFFRPMPTTSSRSLSERSSVSSQSMAVAPPEVTTPAASGPLSRQTASQPPRSDHAAVKGTTDRFGARSITA